MKIQLFLVCLLKFLAQLNQAEGENQTHATDDDQYTDSDQNDTYTWDYGDTESSPCTLQVPKFDSLGLMIIYIIVFVFSAIGNGVVVFVVCSMKRGRTSTDIYLMHLAIADFLFCLTLPFWAVDVHFGWTLGTFSCKLLSGFQEVSVYSGVFLLACISVDRYFAIVRATRVLSSHHLLVKVICSIVWLIAGLLSLPVVIKRESMYAVDLGQFICYENLTGESINQWRVSLRVLRHTLGFFLPLLVMVVCYGWTVLTLFHTRNQHKHKAMRVILAVVLAFILCWFPYNIAVLIDTLIRGGSLVVETCMAMYTVDMIRKVTQVMAFLHCAVNPVLYAFIGEKFRNQLILALFKHGLISQRLRVSFRKTSASSIGSFRSRNTSMSL